MAPGIFCKVFRIPKAKTKCPTCTVELKWRSSPIGKYLARSEDSKRLGNLGIYGRLGYLSFHHQIALGNFVMKPNTGIYHAKFCIEKQKESWELVRFDRYH